MTDVDDYYVSIILETVFLETERGSQMISLHDMSGRWQRELSVRGEPERAALPTATARYR